MKEDDVDDVDVDRAPETRSNDATTTRGTLLGWWLVLMRRMKGPYDQERHRP